jgi:hypothetical protein
MISAEIVNPNISNFINALRDIGYSFEVAVADLIDNCITAQSSIIKILAVKAPSLQFSILDNGEGMSEKQLIEAMRLATKNPKEKREKSDLGRFGLGLKTASFSQCKKLTVLSKKNGILSVRQWDLDYIVEKNGWYLITPSSYEKLPQAEQLLKLNHGTLVCWENLDRSDRHIFSNSIDRLRKHLSLVFHRYLEGVNNQKALKISINNNSLAPFNPFNLSHPATQQIAIEKIKIYGSTITIQPYILPHHSKLSQQEYELYATEEGYIKSQGFYLYRGNRVLIYGTWWGLHKSLDAHKLVRIKIDIPNSMDIKKSIAQPSEEIKKDLKRIIEQITEKGSRPFTGRGRKIEDKTLIQFWEILPLNNEFRFAINQHHPLLKDVKKEISPEVLEKLNLYLKGLQAYLPLEAIQFNLQKSPHLINQKSALSKDDVLLIAKKLKSSGLSKEYIDEILKTEIYLNHKHLFTDGYK